MRQYVAYVKLIISTNHRCSDGTPLDGQHGVSGWRSGSSWHWITKCDTLSWFDQSDFASYCEGKQEEIGDVWELF